MVLLVGFFKGTRWKITFDESRIVEENNLSISHRIGRHPYDQYLTHFLLRLFPLHWGSFMGVWNGR